MALGIRAFLVYLLDRSAFCSEELVRGYADFEE